MPNQHDASEGLVLDDLHVRVAGRDVCRGVSLTIAVGEIHLLLGPNGSGKSSLLAAIMGLPGYEVTGGEIRFRGQRVEHESVTERAHAGIGLAFQRPPSISGVSIRALSAALGSDERMRAHAAELGLDTLLGRGINDGFSGGEIKRWEILKLVLQDPALCLIDEPESGVDLEHVAAVGRAIADLLSTPRADGSARTGLIITHGGQILDTVRATTAHVLADGILTTSGSPRELVDRIKADGYPTA